MFRDRVLGHAAAHDEVAMKPHSMHRLILRHKSSASLMSPNLKSAVPAR